MAKKLHRIMTWILVLALCAGHLAVPANASTGQNVSSVTTPVDGGTQTVTVHVESDGTKTTVTEVNTAKPEEGTSFSSTTTEKVSTTADGQQTSSDTSWDTTTTQTGSETASGNPTVQTDTNCTTRVEGSENTTQTITPGPGAGMQTVEGSTQGTETTTVTDTTVTTTTTTDAFLDEETSSTTTTTPVSNTETETSTGWEEGTVEEGEWQDGQIEKGDTLTTTEKTEEASPLDPSNPGEAIIVMRPDGETEEVRVDVTIDQVLAGMEIPEGAQEIKKDGKVVGYKVVTITETSVQDPNPTVVATEEFKVTQTPTQPSGYQEGTVTEDNVTTVTEAIRDASGSIIGYRVTKTTTTEETSSETTESKRETTTQETTAETVYTLPERPEESEFTDSDGNVVKTVVEDIIEDGRLVGYKRVTTYYDAEGEILRTERNSLYGTTSASSTQIRKDPETEEKTVKTTITETQVNEIYTTVSTRDTTLVTERTNNITTTVLTQEDHYQLVETEDGLYFLYKGTMQPVVALSGHGAADLTGLQPSAKPSKSKDLASSTSITNPPSIVNPGDPGSDQFQYVDYGLISDFRVTKADGYNTSEVHLYKLVDHAGNAYYAYCADMDTTAYRNTIYDISNANDENYYQNNQNKDAYAHLLAIAINGYWGTSGGTGSMDHIRQLLRENGLDNIADTITDGEAMTATQAAIWTFGNKSNSNLVNTGNPAANVSDRDAKRNIEALYDLLISDKLQQATPNTETDIITEKDISGATLQLKGKATDENGNVKKDSHGNEKYNADLTFMLAVEESALTGNLKLVVQDQYGNDLCEEIQLLTEDSNLLGKVLADGTASDYSYTISDLEIAEGVTINLNLVGYQNLQKGVYIYTAASGSHADSQTFIGVAEGTRDVKLQTSLKFTVEDPQIEHVEKNTAQLRRDTRIDRKEDHRTDTKKDTTNKESVSVTKTEDTKIEIYGTLTVTETKQDVTKEERSWESQWKYVLENPSEDPGEDPGDPWTPNQGTTMTTPPKTGDLSSFWAVISCLALGTAILLNRKREET